MSEVFRGFVTKFNTKSGTSKGRNWTAYSARLEGKDGEELPLWFRFGFDNPGVEEGQYIQVTCSEVTDQYATVSKGSVKISKSPPDRAQSKSDNAGGSSSGGSGGSSNYNSDPSRNDRNYHAARASAVSVVDLLLSHDALPTSAAKTKAGTAKRFEEVTAAIDKLTVQYFLDEVSSPDDRFRLFESVADGRVAPADPAGLPDDNASDDSAGDEFPEEELSDDDGF